MSKKIFIFLSLLFVFYVNAQESKNIGLDFNPVLSKSESQFLNEYFSHNSDNFDFTNKKIGFAEDDGEILNKKDFFLKLINNERIKIQLLQFKELEKQNSGNYDAIILFINESSNLKENSQNVFINLLSEREKIVPENIYQMGIVNDSVLNQFEISYFKSIFSDKDFNFKGKKIGFLIGGHIIQTKKDYFDNIKERLSNNTIASQSKGYLIVLTDEEKNKSGGFDAIIFTWCKIIPKINERLLKKLKENGA